MSRSSHDALHVGVAPPQLVAWARGLTSSLTWGWCEVMWGQMWSLEVTFDQRVDTGHWSLPAPGHWKLLLSRHCPLEAGQGVELRGRGQHSLQLRGQQPGAGGAGRRRQALHCQHRVHRVVSRAPGEYTVYCMAFLVLSLDRVRMCSLQIKTWRKIFSWMFPAFRV